MSADSTAFRALKPCDFRPTPGALVAVAVLIGFVGGLDFLRA